jgi:hypothetical protein
MQQAEMRKTVLGVTYQTVLQRAHLKVAGPTEESALDRAKELGTHLLSLLPECVLMPPKMLDEVDDHGRCVCLATILIGVCPEEAKAVIAKIVLRGTW